MNVSALGERVDEMLALYRGALTRMPVVILVAAEANGDALDPYAPDDAAVLLRAEMLALAGARVRTAISQARAELKGSRGGDWFHTSRNGGARGFTCELPSVPTRPVCDEATHSKLWGARDGRWRCTRCGPPRFAGVIVAAAEVGE